MLQNIIAQAKQTLAKDNKTKLGHKTIMGSLSYKTTLLAYRDL
jgi:hypothetical protein